MCDDKLTAVEARIEIRKRVAPYNNLPPQSRRFVRWTCLLRPAFRCWV
jgi:hypothetical protein